jgi:hypothetical protein
MKKTPSHVPSPALQPRSDSVGLELLSKTASELPVVSPDVMGRSNWQPTVPTFDLTGETEDDDDVSYLSPDQCAEIVDSCLQVNDDDEDALAELDLSPGTCARIVDTCLLLESTATPPTKRTKVEA